MLPWISKPWSNYAQHKFIVFLFPGFWSRRVEITYVFSLPFCNGRCANPKGCGMGTLFVLVSPCFRENVVATCKIGSFLCSLDNLLQKNLIVKKKKKKKIIVFFFGNQISKWRSFEKKRAIFDLLFTFFSHQGKVTKFLQHISHSHTYYVFCSPHWLFLSYQLWKKNTNLSGMVFLWVLVLILIWAILEQSINNKMVSKI